MKMGWKFWLVVGFMFLVVILNFILIAEYSMPQAPVQQQPSQGPLAKAMPGQAAIADQFQNQAKPFGWLVDMIQHITGSGMPAQSGQPAPAGDATGKPGADGKGKGKQSQDQSAGQGAQGSGQPGQIDPNQVPELANIFTPGGQAAQQMGLMPHTEGSFGWLLQMMQNQQMQQAQQGGGDLVQIISQLTGGGAGASGGGAAGGSAGAAGAAKAVAAVAGG